MGRIVGREALSEPSTSSSRSERAARPSWVRTTLRSIAKFALRAGPIPRHVAFIMDGNRRFADRCSLQPLPLSSALPPNRSPSGRLHINRASGHKLGYHRMLDALEWCLDLGIT